MAFSDVHQKLRRIQDERGPVVLGRIGPTGVLRRSRWILSVHDR